MDSSHRLTDFQREVLAAFFDRDTEFRLTGGAALVEFYLHHRVTYDLDLFGPASASIDDAERTLRDAALVLGSTFEKQRDFATFRRFFLSRSDDVVLVDLVLDGAPLCHEPTSFGRTRVDVLQEIAANKVCTILSRSEPRDLVDLMAIVRAGADLDLALEDARRKDGGADPASLAWVLSQVHIPSEAILPAAASPDELSTFIRNLETSLRQRAFPRNPPDA